MRAEGHSNSNLTSATRDGVSFDAVHSDNRQQERDATERAEQRRTEFDDPQIWRLLHEIDVGRDLKERQVGIELAKHLPKSWDHSDDCPSILGIESDVHVDLSAITLRQRHKQSGDNIVALNCVEMSAHHPDNFHVVRRAIARRLGVLDVLADCFFGRKKLFRYFFVYDRDMPTLFLLAF